VASCICGLGDIARARSDYDTAQARFKEAQPLYQQVGNVLGVANCIRGLGDIAEALTEREAARAHFEEVLRLCERIPDPYSIGNAHWSLARLAETRADRERHITAARDAYRSVQRDDLIQRLDAAFGG
jgi:tetratricopeptide (TPR) repeat protein